jgi:hypothetical protein
MCKRESISNVLFFVEDMILAFLVTQDNLGVGIFLIHLLFILSRLYDFYTQVPYYYPPVSVLYL